MYRGVVPLENTSFTLPGLLQTYQRANPQAAPQAKAAAKQERDRKIRDEFPIGGAPNGTAGLVFGQ